MARIPGGIFVVDTKKEAIAVAEARKLNIPVFGIVDTNSDPDPISYPIPANDDAFKSISLIVHTITDSIIESQPKDQAELEAALAAEEKPVSEKDRD
jgi:small subunit ribosomal protein S2